MRQIFNKIESHYQDRYEMEYVRTSLQELLDDILPWKESDKHLIKDLRRHIDRLNSLIKIEMKKSNSIVITKED